MLTNKNVLVNGCSFSRGPNSWPYAFQKLVNCELVNLAQAGAGNTYIHDTTIREVATRSYDLAIIMWTGISRIDCQVEDIEYFSQTTYTSAYQSTQNDWPEKVAHPINDQDRVEKTWVFGNGVMNQDSFLVNEKFLRSEYEHCGEAEFVNSFLTNVVSLQSVLNQMNLPYVFLYYDAYQHKLKLNNLYNLIDQQNVCDNDNIKSIMQRLSSYDPDGIHPGIEAHYEVAQNIYNHLRAQ